MSTKPVSVKSIPAIKGQTIYPEPFDSFVVGRTKRKLGNFFELSNFGVNQTELEPGSMSALFHAHSTQDEFIYILEGTPTVKVGSEEYIMNPGECIGFKADTGKAHHLINNSNENVIYLEIGDKSPNDSVEFPNDDFQAALSVDGSWSLTHKDGTPY